MSDKPQNLTDNLEYLLEASETATRKALEEFKNTLAFKNINHLKKEDLQQEVIQKKLEKLDSTLQEIKKLKQECFTEEEKQNEIKINRVKALKYFQKEKYEKTLHYLKKCVHLGDHNVVNFLLGATSCIHLKDYSKAIDWAREAKRYCPDEIQAHLLEGVALMHMKLGKYALKVFREAQKLNPSHPLVQEYCQKAEHLIQIQLNENILDEGTLVISRKAFTDYDNRRKWVRKPLQKKVMITELSNPNSYVVQTTNLSAGGCRLERECLPQEFYFSLMLEMGREITGRAIKVYTLHSKIHGVQFLGLSEEDQTELNKEILRSK